MDYQVTVNPLCTVYTCLNEANFQDCLALSSVNSSCRHLGCAAANLGCSILVWVRVPQLYLIHVIILFLLLGRSL